MGQKYPSRACERRSRCESRIIKTAVIPAIRRVSGLVILVATVALLPLNSLRAQATVGIWDLQSWNYTGTSITTSTVDSTGPKVSGLSTTSNSSSSIHLVGSPGGRIDSTQAFLLPASAPLTETLEQTFALSKPVNFGPLASQSQFNASTISNNGVGLWINIGREDLITGYTLVLTVTGGGKFKSVGGTYVDEPVITGLNSQTVTLTWTTLTSPEILVNRVEIAGAIKSFSASHTWDYAGDYANPGDIPVDAQIDVAMIISNAHPEAPVVKAKGKSRIKTNKRKAVLHGTCFDANDDVAYVQVKVGRKGFRKAVGTDQWRFVARGLKKGKNKVVIVAVDSTGGVSGTERLTIIRKH